MNGWLMVWPHAMGRAESSNARSLKRSGVNSSRGVVSMAFSTFGSLTPCERRARIRRASRVSEVSSSAAMSDLWRRPAEHLLHVVDGFGVGQVDVQGADRNPAFINGLQVGSGGGAGALLPKSHPVFVAAAQVRPLLGVPHAHVAQLLSRHFAFGDLVRGRAREVD